MLARLLRRKVKESQTRRTPRRRQALPALESLERRDAPTATIVDFQDLALAPNSYWNGSDNSGGFTSRGAKFNNSYDKTFGTWSGWSYSDVNDVTTAGYANQYAAFAGTGAGGSGNYGVAFCSDPAFGGALTTVTIPDGMQVQSALFTNTTYAGISMRDGDQFAKKFGPTDWFKLTITGSDASNQVVGSVDYYLAQNGSIVNTWQSVNLGSLSAAKVLTFGLSSSDVGQFGMNTPAYFAMDDLTLVPKDTTYAIKLVGGNTVAAGSTFLATVQASDASGNPLPSYSGPPTATIIASDSRSTSPSTVSLNSSGFGFFIGTMKTAGAQTLSVTAGNFSGTSSITVTPASASYFTVVAPASAATGSPVDVTVTAFDPFGNIATGYTGTVKLTSTDPTAANLVNSYTFTSGAGKDNGVHTFSAALKTGGSQAITATDTTSTNPVITGTSASINTRGLTVTALTPTVAGFNVSFSKAFATTSLNVAGGSVTLSGKLSGPVPGTFVVDATGTSATFKATSTYLQTFFDEWTLPNDTWTVTLKSGTGSSATGFFDASGAPLDGANNGGHADFVTTFDTSADGKAALGVPDFARGPDSASTIKVPNNSAKGLPVTLANAPAGTKDVVFTLHYNPTLLTLTKGDIVDSALAGSTFTMGAVNNVDAAHANVTFTWHNGTGNASAGNIVLGDIIATDPSTSASQYKAKDLMTIDTIGINGVAATGTYQVLHLNAYFGDLSGDGQITSLDLANASNVASGAQTSLSGYKLIDPALVGDIPGNGAIDAGAVSSLANFLAHNPTPAIPTPPSGLTITPSGPDPTLSLGTGEWLVVRGEGPVQTIRDSTTHQSTFTVPVLLDQPRPEGSLGMTEAILGISYDPKVLTVSASDITLGWMPDLDSVWQLVSVIDQVTGQIAIDLYSTTPIMSNLGGSLVNIAFHTVPGATEPETVVRLVNVVTPNGLSFSTEVADDQGRYVLSPGMDRLVVGTGSSLSLVRSAARTRDRRIRVHDSGIIRNDESSQ
jgi:hypothetical protein